MFYDEPNEGHKPNNKVGLYTTVVMELAILQTLALVHAPWK